MRRRCLLSGTAGLAAGLTGGLANGPSALVHRAFAQATMPGAMLPGAAKILVPGPEDGALARWTAPLAQALARGAGTAVNLERECLGGADGVTAANRFATSAAPDGRMLLVLPGAAAQARLVGDPRARFDSAGWLPVAATQFLVVVAGRDAWPRPGDAGLGSDTTLRLGLPTAEAAEAVALLGLDLLGVPATPVLGLPGGAAEAALAQGAVEAIVLRGAEVSVRLAALGARAWFVLAAARDPRLPEVPAAAELPLTGLASLQAAFRAGAAAARLEAALVLPALTPADLVALWRGAAQRWVEEGRAGAGTGLRSLSGTEAIPLLTTLAPPASAVSAYRRWLLQRLNWQPE